MKTTMMICDYADDVDGDEELRGDDGGRVPRLRGDLDTATPRSFAELSAPGHGGLSFLR